MLFWLFILAALVAVYWFVARPVLRRRPELADLYAQADGFWARLNVRLKGLRTRLAARLYLLAGAFVSLYDVVIPMTTGVDWSPLTAKIPPVAWPFIMIGTGILFAWLRNVTTSPAGEKE